MSYCDTGDVYCSSGNNSKVHGLYLVNYPEQMKKFVIDNYDQATGSTGGSNKTTTTAGPTTTAGSKTSPTSGASATATSGDNKSGAAGVSTSLMYAVPAALVAAAQMFL